MHVDKLTALDPNTTTTSHSKVFPATIYCGCGLALRRGSLDRSPLLRCAIDVDIRVYIISFKVELSLSLLNNVLNRPRRGANASCWQMRRLNRGCR